MTSLRLRLSALALVACLAALLVPAVGSAAGPRTIHLLDLVLKQSTTFAPNAKAGPKPGDQAFSHDAVYRYDGAVKGAKVGTVEAILTFISKPDKSGLLTADITGQVFLAGGSLRFDGISKFGNGPSHVTLAIVGGTGTYAGARGTLEIRDLDSTGMRSALDIHLLA